MERARAGAAAATGGYGKTFSLEAPQRFTVALDIKPNNPNPASAAFRHSSEKLQ